MGASIPMGLQMASAMFGAVSESNGLRGQADADMENARLSSLQGAINEANLRRRGRAVQGEAIAANAGNGVGADSGSVQDQIFQNSLDMEYAALDARYSAANEARGYKMKAAQERQAARAALFGGVLRAGAAAVTGISSKRNQQREDAANNDYYNAYFPGGQQLPMPSGGATSTYGGP